MPEHFAVRRQQTCLHIAIDRPDAGNLIPDPMLVDLEPALARLLAKLEGFSRIDIATVKRFIATGLTLSPDIMSDLAGFTMATVKSRDRSYR